MQLRCQGLPQSRFMSHCLAQERCWLACPYRLLQICRASEVLCQLYSNVTEHAGLPRLKVFLLTSARAVGGYVGQSEGVRRVQPASCRHSSWDVAQLALLELAKQLRKAQVSLIIQLETSGTTLLITQLESL